MDYPYLTQDLPDMEYTESLSREDEKEPVQYIKNMQNGSTAGYKYFDLSRVKSISLQIRGKAKGKIEVRTCLKGEVIGSVQVDISTEQWQMTEGLLKNGESADGLYFTFNGRGTLDFRGFVLSGQ